MEPQRLLFVPVSAARGTGEYARAVAIAQAYQQHCPSAEIRFIVSAEAPYANSVPFPADVLPRSPTFHSREVTQIIARLRPHVVVFDNAGRTAQLRAARAAGARTVFVSSRARQRRRAFRLRWMRLLDEHWIAYPALISGPPGRIERLKLRLLRRPRLRFLDVLMPAISRESAAAALARFGLQRDRYVLVVPGGGVAHRAVADAPGVIAAAALRIAAHGHKTLLIGVPAGAAAADLPAALAQSPLVPMSDLLALIDAASLVVVNGGDTLLQVIALRRACVAVSMSPDQTLRLARLARAGLDCRVALDADAISAAAMRLLSDPQVRQRRAGDTQRIALQDGLATAVDALATLMAPGG